MNTNWVLMSSKNLRDENKQKAKRSTNDVTIATMSFPHLDNNSMIHDQANQVSFSCFSIIKLKPFANFFFITNPLILFGLFISNLHQIKMLRLNRSQTSPYCLESQHTLLMNNLLTNKTKYVWLSSQTRNQNHGKNGIFLHTLDFTGVLTLHGTFSLCWVCNSAFYYHYNRAASQ